MRNASHTSSVLTLTVIAFAAAAGAFAPAARAQKSVAAPERIKAAQELLQLTGAARNFDTIMPTMMANMTRVLVTQKPEHRDMIEKLMAEMLVKFTARKQELIDQIAVIYAERLSGEDIAGMVAFFKSPVGRKFISVQPDLMKASMAAGQVWGQKIGAEITDSVRDELKKRGVDL